MKDLIFYVSLPDMETNGVYFEDSPTPEKEEEKKEETICQYSGLPSVESYMVLERTHKE